jgi:hypothetical protein
MKVCVWIDCCVLVWLFSMIGIMKKKIWMKATHFINVHWSYVHAIFTHKDHYILAYGVIESVGWWF